ncbi:MAG: hypothetical protein E6G04_06525 [Actinobacteria bacterium]|nr:MAG: hypothetical protein E6G04_06525 [Actinomycetota bacterium]
MPASRRAVARATELAFGGRFTEALETLGSATSEHAQWVRAYVASSRGEFARARALAAPLAELAHARAVRVAAGITLGSVLRQTARHARAEAWDQWALDQARTDAERAHALIGLAADAIGRHRVSSCDARLAEADAIGVAADWRAQVRLDWVRVERALTIGRPRDGLRPGKRGVRIARGADARRHVAKSRLFYGVALVDAGFLAAARRELTAALRGAQACGAGRVARVAHTVLEQKAIQAAG